MEIWAGVYDGLTALQADRLGFDGLWLSSLGVAVGRLGQPDAGFIEAATMEQAVREIRNCTTRPMAVDFENGYGLCGGELGAAGARLIGAGGTSVCIEDTSGPKRNSLWPGTKRDLWPVDEMSGRIASLVRDVDAAGGFVIARTESIIESLGVEDSVERVLRYAEAGARAVVVHFRDDVEPVLRVAEKTVDATRLVIIPTAAPEMTVDEFERAGFQVYVAANIALRATSSAVSDSLGRVLRTGSQAEAARGIATLSDLDSLVGTAARLATDPR